MATAPKTHRPLNSGTARQEYDKRRGSAQERGYDWNWHKLRAWYVESNPLCEDCADNGITVVVDEVDHIIPINGKNDRLLLDAENLRSRCKACHTRKTHSMDDRNRIMFDFLIGFGHDHDDARDAVLSWQSEEP